MEKEGSHGGSNNHFRGEREKYEGPVDAAVGEYYKGLVREKEALDPKDFPNVTRLIERGSHQLTLCLQMVMSKLCPS